MIDYARVMLEKSEKNLEEGMEYFDGRADFAFYSQFEDYVQYQKERDAKNSKITIVTLCISALTLFVSIVAVILAMI